MMIINSAHAQKEVTIPDKDIQIVTSSQLEYPTLARTSLTQGVVVVRAQLNANGNVVDATALSGAKTLISACLDNIMKWRFRPNEEGSIIVVYNFRVVDGALRKHCNQFTVHPPNFVTISSCAPEIQ